MCGIAGYYSRSHRDFREVMQNMGARIAHRGPDDSGSVTFDRAGLHNRRLSIIDVERGHQPFVSDDGRIAIVQNGEIYNYRELADELRSRGIGFHSQSDTEVLLRLYETHGIDFLPKLNGMFAMAIYDARLGRLYLVRDRIGVKPLYVFDDGDTLSFASEIKALLAAGIPVSPSPEAIDLFLAFNFVPPPLTAFKGVRHVMPGTCLVIDDAGVRVDTWWDLAGVEVSQEPDEPGRGMIELMADAVRLRLRSDVPFGAFLSGGVDSSIVVGLMAAQVDPVETFSIGFRDPAYDESPYAEAASTKFGTNHHAEIVEEDLLEEWPRAIFHTDQPHGDVSFLPTYRVARNAARSVKVVLTGDGGDELFAGYQKYVDFFSGGDGTQSSGTVDWRRYAKHISLFDERGRRELYTPGFASRVDLKAAEASVLERVRQVGHQDNINAALYLDMMMLMPGNNLVKPDRMAMAVSLEARSPFLDYRVVEYAFGIPGYAKLRRGRTKAMLKDAFQPLLGELLASQGKRMFTVPIGDWLRSEKGAVALGFLTGQSFRDRGIADPRMTQRLIQEHCTGTRNHTREIRALIALELWFRIFIDRQSTSPPDWASLASA